MKRYIKASIDNPIPDWLRNDPKALKALNRAGIDVKSMLITDTPTGRGRDYPIYYIDDQFRPFIWIPGIYQDDMHLINPATRNYESVKYVPKKYLNILDTVYLSKTDYKKEPDPSRGYKDPRYVYDRYNPRRGQYAGQYQKRNGFGPDAPLGEWSTGGIKRDRDKSGYVIPNPEEKLKEFYAASGDQGTKRLASRLEQVYNKLVDLKSRIFDIDFADFGLDYKGEPDYSSTAYQNILSIFGDTCRNYRFALNDAAKAERSTSETSKEYYIADALDDIKDCERRIRDIEEAIREQRY